MYTEFEKDSAPSLENFLRERNLDTVAFDIDNTLLATHEYYRQALYEIGMDVAERNTTSRRAEDIATEFIQIVLDEYKRGNYRPILMDEQCESALRRHFGDSLDPNLLQIVNDLLEDFYTTSPQIYEATPHVLQVIKSLGAEIVLHSHAQEEWTRIKAEDLSFAVGFTLPYLATDITEEKDSSSWLRALQLIDRDISKTLVIGDSFTSDILPAIHAGCKHLVWIDYYGTGIPQNVEIPSDVEIVVVKNIQEILKLK